MAGRLRDAILRGTNAARPAATAVAVGTLYYDTTNSLLSRSSGSAWESVGEAAGGGGAPTGAEYLVTAADATLTAERVVDLGAYQLLTRRAAANAEDDHFNSSPLAAKWLAYTGFDATTDLTTIPGWCSLTANGSKVQPVPAGDWTVEVELLHPDSPTAAYTSEGIMLADSANGTTGKSARFGYGRENSLTIWRYVIDLFNAGPTYASTPQSLINQPFHAAGYTFLRVVKVGTSYHLEASATGKRWHRVHTNSAIGFVPTHFGFFGEAGAAFNYFLRY